MEPNAFDTIEKQLQELYHRGEYAAALELATRSIAGHPEQATYLDYWRMTMAARSGDTALALDVLQQALHAGRWYSDLLLRRSPSFKDLQAEPAFERLIALNQEMAERDHERVFPLYTLRPEKRCLSGRKPPCPLLLALHSNAGTVHTSLSFWLPAATAGWLVAAPQSSQAIWKDAYVWDDREVAESEIHKHFVTLNNSYAIDPQRTLLAGHSMGGEIAIWLALKGTIPARGFLAIGPGGPFMDDLAEWEPLLRERPAVPTPGARRSPAAAGLRGYIITGAEDDSIPHKNIRRLVDRLNRAGIPSKLETIPGVGHDYADAYQPAILRGLQFVLDWAQDFAAQKDRKN
jgi:predicted esterase